MVSVRDAASNHITWHAYRIHPSESSEVGGSLVLLSLVLCS